MRLPRPFTVLRDGKIVLVVHCYSLAAARALIAARLADTTGIRIVAQR